MALAPFLPAPTFPPLRVPRHPVHDSLRAFKQVAATSPKVEASHHLSHWGRGGEGGRGAGLRRGERRGGGKGERRGQGGEERAGGPTQLWAYIKKKRKTENPLKPLKPLKP